MTIAALLLVGRLVASHLVASLVSTKLGTILAAYVIVLGSFAALAWRTVSRGKRLARHVPPEERPWT